MTRLLALLCSVLLLQACAVPQALPPATDLKAGQGEVVALAAHEAVNVPVRQYLNRLSDLLFVLARVLNRANLDGRGGDDVYWRSTRLQRDRSA